MRKAWFVVALAAACNGSTTAVPDAAPPPPPDAPPPPPPDAAPPDAAPPDAQALPNLILLGDRTASSLEIDFQNFSMNSCSLDEMCIEAAGMRKLLRFDTVTANIGSADLVVGVPGSDMTFWEWSGCHMHFHFSRYATYELVGPMGVVATGRKQAFCLEDTDQIDPTKPGQMFTCSFQGISAGWADTYGTYLPCQWIDITDVPPGDYTLRLAINPERILLEQSYDDNTFEMPVHID